MWSSKHATLPSQMCLCNRYEALDVEGHSTDDICYGMCYGPPTPEVSSRSLCRDHLPGKERWVIFAGDSLLKGTEGPICLLGKSADSFGSRLRASLGNFLAWYSPRTATHYCFSM